MSEHDPSPAYSIKAAAHATGLSVETLRAWERRYCLVEPRRDCSGHRIYTAADIARLKRLRETTERGHSIGKIAALSDAELDLLLAGRVPEPEHCEAARALTARILRAIEKYDLEECDQSIAMAFALLPIADVVSDVLSPVLQEVGERWFRGEFSIGQERLVSSAVRRQISGLLNTYNSSARGATIVFATVAGESHELGILMFAALAASRKLRACYLGAEMPPEEISNFAAKVGAHAVAIGMVLPENNELALRQLVVLRGGLPGAIELWVGGAAADELDPGALPAGSIQMGGRADFERRLDALSEAKG